MAPYIYSFLIRSIAESRLPNANKVIVVSSPELAFICEKQPSLSFRFLDLTLMTKGVLRSCHGN